MTDIILKTKIIHDEYTQVCQELFDVPWSEESVTIIKNNLNLNKPWNILLLYGSSGSGKSTLLKTFGEIKTPTWNEKPIISNFLSVSPQKAAEILCACGFASIPNWMRPYHVLSNGEKFRADLARLIAESKQNEVIIVDEYASFVNLTIAQSASNSLQKYIRKNNLKMVLASCRDDFIEYLKPDVIYNTNEGVTKFFSDEELRGRVCPDIKISRCSYKEWHGLGFSRHHYFSQDLNPACKCFLLYFNGEPAAFYAIMAFPHPTIKRAYRGSRLVVLPEYQGLGLGIFLSNNVASLCKKKGFRFFVKAAHPIVKFYRNSHPELWKHTTHSGRKRKEFTPIESKKWSMTSEHRSCDCWEWVGEESDENLAKLFDIQRISSKMKNRGVNRVYTKS